MKVFICVLALASIAFARPEAPSSYSYSAPPPPPPPSSGYSYQAPAPAPIPQSSYLPPPPAPSYSAPAPSTSYGPPAPPIPSYAAPAPVYGAPAPVYAPAHIAPTSVKIVKVFQENVIPQQQSYSLAPPASNPEIVKIFVAQAHSPGGYQGPAQSLAPQTQIIKVISQAPGGYAPSQSYGPPPSTSYGPPPSTSYGPPALQHYSVPKQPEQIIKLVQEEAHNFGHGNLASAPPPPQIIKVIKESAPAIDTYNHPASKPGWQSGWQQ